jgi:hypothetical protein
LALGRKKLRQRCWFGAKKWIGSPSLSTRVEFGKSLDRLGGARENGSRNWRWLFYFHGKMLKAWRSDLIVGALAQLVGSVVATQRS